MVGQQWGDCGVAGTSSVAVYHGASESSTYVGLMLVHRLRRWPNIKSKYSQRSEKNNLFL